MLPELARRAISAYTEPGALIVDPMCGIGTSLIEAIHLDRNAVGVELERRWASLATANLAHAREQGAPGQAGVLEGDARQLPRLLTQASKRYRSWFARNTEGNQERAEVARLGAGLADLILLSPPYCCQLETIDKRAWLAGGTLGDRDSRNYSRNRRNLGHARGQKYLEAMSEVYAASAAALKPGGFLITVTKNLRAGGEMHNLAGETVALCQQAGLLYWQHVIALHAAIRGSELVARPSFWQLSTIRKALARGERVQLVCHEDVLVFRKAGAAAAGRSEAAEMRRAA